MKRVLCVIAVAALFLSVSGFWGCSDLKCEVQYDKCMAGCDGSLTCEIGCKAERKWCRL